MSNELFMEYDENETAVIESPSTVSRYLTFTSDGITFGVNSDFIIEIINNHTIRPIPRVPEYVQGVINLRGQIIPIVDMRLRMGKAFKEYDSQTCTIILEVDSNTIGIVVDSVCQVIDIDVAKASPIPVENRQRFTNYMIDISGTIILLLECEELIND